MLLRLIALSLIAFFASVTSLSACSVPVFRYALERWSPDLFEVSVFYRGTLSDADGKRLNQLEDLAVHNGGAVNWEVVRCNLDERVPEDLLAVWKSWEDAPLPAVVVRMPRKATGQSTVWQGRLSDPFLNTLATSPARREIAQRLMSGDSVVWLLVRGSDSAVASRTKDSLDSALKQLGEELELPPGIGRPGSELLAKIPLQLKFSVVEVTANSHDEQAVIQLLRSGMAKPSDASDSLIVPVFGRGRVLDVLSARDLDSETVTDLTRYLCSACSCQVKQQNPGFDLICDVKWEERLFDETFDSSALASADLREAAASSRADAEATLVAIPPGHAPLVASTSSTEFARSPTGRHIGFLFAIAALAVAAALIVFTR